MNLPRYIIQFLDPANITQGYRPVQGLYVLLQYTLFHFNSDGYHLTHQLLHAMNGVLLFLIAGRLSRMWRVAIIAGLFFVASPIISLAVFWNAVVDPLSAFFYLLTILLWTKYLDARTPWRYVTVYVVYLFALFSKEVAIFLPVILFLIEWWFYREPINLPSIVKRYGLFVIVWVPYILLELAVHSHGEFVGQFGFSIGSHMLGNLLPYLAVLAFPWTMVQPTEPIYYIWLAIVLIVFIAILLRTRNLALLFLGIFALLNISPLSGFPLQYYNTRYLYNSLMASVVVIAWLIEYGRRRIGEPQWYTFASAFAVVVILFAGGQRIGDNAMGLAEFTRQIRVPFRDISRAHPTFPDDTYLYFAYPISPVVDLEGLFFVRYGQGVKVDGTDWGNPSQFRKHKNAFAYYFDETGKPIEIVAHPQATTKTNPGLPIHFSEPITLEDYEVSNTAIQRGKALIITLNWRGGGTPSKDYTVFARFVDADGKQIASLDGPPKRGELPTSTWKRGPLYVDTIVLPIGANTPMGDNCRLELGLYGPESMQRLSIVDANGQPINDKIVIESFSIVP
jgi:hypothetical protein